MLVRFLVARSGAGNQDQLDKFFKNCHLGEAVHSTAFVKSRKKLKAAAFVELSDRLLSRFYASPMAKRWNGFVLCAIDGSGLLIPDTPDVRKEFPPEMDFGDKNKELNGRGVICYDVLNGMVVKSGFGGMATGEREYAAQILKEIQGMNALVLLDRGFPAAWLFTLLFALKINFCARMPDSFTCVRKFRKSKRREQVVTLTHSHMSEKSCAKHDIPPEGVTVRLIRVKIPGGKSAVLATSLMDAEVYPAETFGELYRKRWGVESGFLKLKCFEQIEAFSGLSGLSVRQDFHARMMAHNLASLITCEAREKVERQMADEIADESHRRTQMRRLNGKYATDTLRADGLRLFTLGFSVSVYRKLIRLISKRTEAVRPERKFRHKRRKGPKLNRLSARPGPHRRCAT